MYEIVYFFVALCVVDVHVLLKGQYHNVGGNEGLTTGKCDHINGKV